MWTDGGTSFLPPDTRSWTMDVVSTSAMLSQVVFLLHFVTLTLGQYDICKSLVSMDNGQTWEFYACQPKPTAMKEFMQITVDPPGISCGDPPERFCTLVSFRFMIFTMGLNFEVLSL